MIQSTYALPENQSLLSYAQDYLQRGLCVIPVRPDSKAALVRWQRYQKQRPSESSVRNWFSRWPDARIGVVFGAVSHGLGSRDFDDAASYEEWRAEHRDVAETLPTSATARGYHVFFRLLPDMARETRARLGRGTNGAVTLQRDGHSLGELRFDCGCFSVLPPSSHPSGKYEWIVPLPQDLQNVPCVDIFRTQIVPPYSFATLHSTHSHTCITSNTCHVIGFAEESCAAVLRSCGDVARVAYVRN